MNKKVKEVDESRRKFLKYGIPVVILAAIGVEEATIGILRNALFPGQKKTDTNGGDNDIPYHDPQDLDYKAPVGWEGIMPIGISTVIPFEGTPICKGKECKAYQVFIYEVVENENLLGQKKVNFSFYDKDNPPECWDPDCDSFPITYKVKGQDLTFQEFLPLVKDSIFMKARVKKTALQYKVENGKVIADADYWGLEVLEMY